MKECLRKAMVWAGLPWPYFVDEWLRIADEKYGPVPSNAKAEILATLKRNTKFSGE